MESYHELSMVYEDMARSCEVSIQLYLVKKSHFGFHTQEKFLKDMEVLPIMKTPGEFDGAEFCFADLLKDKKKIYIQYYYLKVNENPLYFEMTDKI